MVEAKRPSGKRPVGCMQVRASEAVGMGEMDVQRARDRRDIARQRARRRRRAAGRVGPALQPRARGLRTYTASNGLEAMEELRKHHPMLMVLDLMMPEMDGWAVLKELTKLPDEQRPRIVIVSALTGPDDKAKATALGADAFVPKPFDVEELIGVLGGLAKAS